MGSERVKVFNDSNFDQKVLGAGLPVLVDFTAPWCGPCKALSPIVAQLADELDGKVIVGQVNVDQSPATAGKYGVRGVPMLLVFNQGERVAQHLGLTTKAKIKEMVGL